MVGGRVDASRDPGNVTALGYVSDVASLFGRADVFVLPTLEEDGPQVTYEAAGCGLPIITTPMGAARIIENGVSGIVVAPGSISELANAIRQLAASSELRSRYGAAAKSRNAEFTFRRVSANRAWHFLELLDPRVD